MKRLLSVSLVLAMTLAFVAGSVSAKYIPRVIDRGTSMANSGSTGDDHPWGGEGQSSGWTGGVPTGSHLVFLSSGYPAVDLILRLFHKDLWFLESQTSRSIVNDSRDNTTTSNPLNSGSGTVTQSGRGGAR